MQKVPLDDEDAWGSGAADKFVGGEEDGVFVQRASLLVGHVHFDFDVGSGGGEVPEGEGVVLMEEACDGGGVGADAGDVGGGREASDFEGAVGVFLELEFEVFEVDLAVGVFVDDDDVGDGFSPGEFVGVVFVGADEDDGALFGRDVLGEVVAGVEVVGDAQVEDVDEFVDGAGGA